MQKLAVAGEPLAPPHLREQSPDAYRPDLRSTETGDETSARRGPPAPPPHRPSACAAVKDVGRTAWRPTASRCRPAIASSAHERMYGDPHGGKEDGVAVGPLRRRRSRADASGLRAARRPRRRGVPDCPGGPAAVGHGVAGRRVHRDGDLAGRQRPAPAQPAHHAGTRGSALSRGPGRRSRANAVPGRGGDRVPASDLHRGPRPPVRRQRSGRGHLRLHGLLPGAVHRGTSGPAAADGCGCPRRVRCRRGGLLLPGIHDGVPCPRPPAAHLRRAAARRPAGHGRSVHRRAGHRRTESVVGAPSGQAARGCAPDRGLSR